MEPLKPETAVQVRYCARCGFAQHYRFVRAKACDRCGGGYWSSAPIWRLTLQDRVFLKTMNIGADA